MTDVTRITKGLNLPIAGAPEQEIEASPPIRHVALLGDDYHGMKPTMAVAVGDTVKAGQVVFTDKKNPGVQFTAPAAGKVVAVNRGEKRRFESLVIEVDGDASESFPTHDGDLAALDRKVVRDQLVASGLWTTLRTRPYSKTPAIDAVPAALFINAADTNPLCADPAVILERFPDQFVAGIKALSTLSDQVFVGRNAGSKIPGEGETPAQFHAFSGPHPAGLVGTHIHTLRPVSMSKSVWHIGYQDVVAVGHLFLNGQLLTERIVSLAGPLVEKPRLLRTRLGASVTELSSEQLKLDEGQTARVISGSVLSGRHAAEPVDFLGRFHNQVSVLAEGGERDFLGWLMPGENKFSIRPVFASAWSGAAKREPFSFNTSTEGSPRAIVPIGMFEDVMPLDIIATPLLKALIMQDTEFAQQLGVLELDEEDIALCTYVCAGKHDYGPMLRQCLTTIEVEG